MICVFSLDLHCLCLRCIACVYNCEVLQARWCQKTGTMNCVLFRSLVLITSGLSVVCGINLRIVEFRSVEMLSNSRMRDVFQMQI